MQFIVLDKFTIAYYTKLQEKSCYYLLITYMKKHHRKSRQTKFWKQLGYFLICTRVTNFALVSQENALVFSQSEAPNFFMYIIVQQQRHYSSMIIVPGHFLSQQGDPLVLMDHQSLWCNVSVNPSPTPYN